MRTIGNVLDAICAVISGLCMMAMVAIYCADSIGRQFNMPIGSAPELVSILLGVFLFSSLSIVLRENANIAVGLFVEFYKPVVARIEQAISVLVEALGTVLLAYLVVDFAIRRDRIGALTTYYEIPEAPFVYLYGAFAALSVFFIVERIVRHRPDRRPEYEQSAHQRQGADE